MEAKESEISQTDSTIHDPSVTPTAMMAFTFLMNSSALIWKKSTKKCWIQCFTIWRSWIRWIQSRIRETGERVDPEEEAIDDDDPQE